MISNMKQAELVISLVILSISCIHAQDFSDLSISLNKQYIPVGNISVNDGNVLVEYYISPIYSQANILEDVFYTFGSVAKNISNSKLIRIECLVGDKSLYSLETNTSDVLDYINGRMGDQEILSRIRINEFAVNETAFTLNATNQTSEGIPNQPSMGNNSVANPAINSTGNISTPSSLTLPGASGSGTSTTGVLNPSGNNQIGDTAEVAPGQTMTQSISPAGSGNYYRFHVDTSGILKLRLDSVPADMKPVVYLLDKNFGEIAYKAASNAGDALTLEKDILGPGSFYIDVSDQDGKAHSEPYSLKTSFEPAPDQYEPNPNYYRAIEVKPGQTISAYICPSGDEDFYKIHVDSPGIIKLELGSVPKDMKPDITVVDKSFSGSMAYSAASNPGDKVKLVKDVAGPGWYFIKIRDIDGKAHSDPYSLKVDFEPALDKYDPNPNFFRAVNVALGQSITAYICPGGEGDYYKIQVSGPGVLKADLNSVPADMKSQLSLYDKTFSQIAYSSALNPGDKVSLEKDVQGPGWYYINVMDPTGKAFSEPYTLTVAM
jgi:hypothetical protein